MQAKQMLAVITAVVGLIVCVAFSSQFVENLDSGEIMVVQAPMSGNLTWHTEAGMKWQGFGKVTKYPKRAQFWFSKDAGTVHPGQSSSIKIRFNDGAHADISGSLSWEMPMVEEQLSMLHSKYGSEEAIDKQLIRTNLEKSLYMTGPLMSSSESYATRRNDLLGIIDDQVQHGIYKTNGRDERQTDPITGQQKTVKIVEPVKGVDGKFERVEPSPLEGLGIAIFNLSINDVKYDPTVEAQIQKQQESIMAVQSALAESKAAEQQVLTTQAQGAASAAKAEWEQKVLMATAVTAALQAKEVALTEAAQKFEVAQLETQAAEQKKLGEILLGEGEAMRRKLVMDADGSLDRKLEAWINVNQAYARAIGEHQGSWVPSVVMGGQGPATGNGNAAQDLVSLLTAKTAKDLAIDTVIPEKSGTLPPIKRPELPTFKFVPTNLTTSPKTFTVPKVTVPVATPLTSTPEAK